MTFLRYIAFPLMPFYYVVTWLRNYFYDQGFKASTSYDFPVICVGNLSVGGTGKTPMIEYLIGILKDHKRLATLSRGYRRKSKGFVLADRKIEVEFIGDEPFQFYNKFKDTITVAVDEDRRHGISKLRGLDSFPEVILLDDAFQHRKVNAGLNILLTTYSNLYTNDWVLPTGNLREPRSGANRAQIIVVTKCPKEISPSKKDEIINKINPKLNQQVFFSFINYSEDIISETKRLSLSSVSNFTLVTGIANAKPLTDYLRNEKLSFQHLEYSDHHHFSNEDIVVLEKQDFIVTTEKDYMRLKPIDSLKSKLYYLPIEIGLDNSEKFEACVTQFISE